MHKGTALHGRAWHGRHADPRATANVGSTPCTTASAISWHSERNTPAHIPHQHRASSRLQDVRHVCCWPKVQAHHVAPHCLAVNLSLPMPYRAQMSHILISRRIDVDLKVCGHGDPRSPSTGPASVWHLSCDHSIRLEHSSSWGTSTAPGTASTAPGIACLKICILSDLPTGNAGASSLISRNGWLPAHTAPRHDLSSLCDYSMCTRQQQCMVCCCRHLWAHTLLLLMAMFTAMHQVAASTHPLGPT